MYYYADGDYKLLRFAVDAADRPDMAEFRAAPAQRYVGGGGWTDQRPNESLAAEALMSGDFSPVDEPEAERIMGVLDAEAKSRG
jgi:hypothetical protein